MWPGLFAALSVIPWNLGHSLRATDVPRRSLIKGMMGAVIGSKCLPNYAVAEETKLDETFESAAYPRRELTNSIVASRDTNVSPMEVYDTLQTRLRRNQGNENTRALDVGAGAGVSTQVIYQLLGYRNIDAVDWSGEAWELNVVEEGHCPPGVHFYALDDERFVMEWKEQGLPKYDVIAFNFAINIDKAMFFCQHLLKPDGLLLAPINSQKDYWLKQTYQLLDAEGNVQWSAMDVGAWSVQFQPDVTQDTCQGIWCPPYNGFKKMSIYN